MLAKSLHLEGVFTQNPKLLKKSIALLVVDAEEAVVWHFVIRRMELLPSGLLSAYALRCPYSSGNTSFAN
ncbi:hypothetical protein H6F61_15160 [Cyanobacteria bacterium FACHB-472]|nr:hypothetical protein [Cyanobacteria bacterium FACHB-472]